jgi:hypothetical protein
MDDSHFYMPKHQAAAITRQMEEVIATLQADKERLEREKIDTCMDHQGQKPLACPLCIQIACDKAQKDRERLERELEVMQRSREGWRDDAELNMKNATFHQAEVQRLRAAAQGAYLELVQQHQLSTEAAMAVSILTEALAATDETYRQKYKRDQRQQRAGPMRWEKNVTDNEERLRKFAEGLGDLDRNELLRPCPVEDYCNHGDCQLANMLLAMLDKGNERFASWRIHRNDSPELGQDMWQETVAAALIVLEEK